MNRLTNNQEDVLKFILKYTDLHPFPPTGVEIARACSFKTAQYAYKVLDQLASKSFLKRDKRVSRGIHLNYEMIEAHFGRKVRRVQGYGDAD